jgi:NAD(P)H-hydrate epimerase
MPARVATAAETQACERATIDAGTPSAELMRRAGHAAAEIIATKYEIAARDGVTIYAGPGNNGGDGWVVGESLAHRGFPVSVMEVGSPRSPEAIDAKRAALAEGVHVDGKASRAGVIVDGLLGTGSTGVPRSDIARAISEIEELRSAGAHVVALDLPSGLDATSGAHDGCVRATCTVTFGVLKRGELIARDVCGEIEVADIGLSGTELEQLPLAVDDAWVHSRIPSIPNDAHKGVRKRLIVAGGGKGMAGAAILSGEGALRTGIGVLRIIAHGENVAAIQAGIPEALSAAFPQTAEEIAAFASSVDAITIGPGLGKSDEARDLVERILIAWSGPVVVDADAINVFAGDLASLSKLLKGRKAILTPHPAEMGRLIGVSTDEVLANRFDVGLDVAHTTGAAILLKGVPTVVSDPGGKRYVVTAGTAALATGGSGDILSGIAGTLLAQMTDSTAAEAAACAAFIHGRSAELCRFVRGITLDDVLHAMPIAWNEQPLQLPPGILARLEKRA